MRLVFLLHCLWNESLEFLIVLSRQLKSFLGSLFSWFSRSILQPPLDVGKSVRNRVSFLFLQKKLISSNAQKAPMGTHLAPQANFTFANPAAYVTGNRPVFVNNPMHSNMASHTCCRLTYVITELTRWLLSKDLCKTVYHIYPTPPLGQDMTQGQFFLKRSLIDLNSELSFS